LTISGKVTGQCQSPPWWITPIPSPTDLKTVTAELQKTIAAGNYPYPTDEDSTALAEKITDAADIAIWAPGQVVWDDPSRLVETGEAGDMIEMLHRKIENVQESFTIESAYFVVRDGGVERIKELVDSGVKVRILTNSLVSNDVLAAHAGHAKYRKRLLEVGAEVYELRADAGVIKKNWQGESRAGLHTKAMIFDEQTLFIGSFNLDPRSANINTEAGLYVESPPEHSYRLKLDDDGDLVWITEDDGVEVRYDKDPLSTFGQRFMSGFIGILPMESQL
jgi:putative cardiolipin synthase